MRMRAVSKRCNRKDIICKNKNPLPMAEDLSRNNINLYSPSGSVLLSFNGSFSTFFEAALA